jgi:peptide/nickel transport system permease protein
MRRYILRRILLFIPTFIVITLLSFIILVNAPGDPVERMMTSSQSSGDISTQSVAQKEQRNYWTHRLGLDLPVFYFSIHSLAEPDTLYRITDKSERKALSLMISQYGNWEDIQLYYLSELQLEDYLSRVNCGMLQDSVNCNEFKKDLSNIRFETAALKYASQERMIQSKINAIKKFFAKYSLDQNPVEILRQNYGRITVNASSWKDYLPALSFHPNNQYHRWLFGDGLLSKGLLQGDFGISYLSKQPVSKIISGKIGWSLFFTLFSVLLAYLVSIPIAIKSAAKKNSRFDNISSLVLFMLYSLPTFWVATLLLMTFANTDVLNIFPASGVKPVTGYPADANLLEKIKLSLPYLILPTICYTYSSLAFLSRTLRVSMIEILSQDFIRTARAKGLSEKAVLWKHALKNSLLPIITVFANVFPYMIGGSVILESIFTIPGMGSAIYTSIDAQDYPMIVAVFTLTGLLTMAGYLLSDLLYAIVDPRISFSKLQGA